MWRIFKTRSKELTHICQVKLWNPNCGSLFTRDWEIGTMPMAVTPYIALYRIEMLFGCTVKNAWVKKNPVTGPLDIQTWNILI